MNMRLIRAITAGITPVIRPLHIRITGHTATIHTGPTVPIMADRIMEDLTTATARLTTADHRW